MRFADKTVIVTGGAGGIGRACVKLFADEGAAVVVADNDAGKGEATAAEVVSAGGHALFIETDVGDAASATGLVAKTIERFGRLDVLVNNAGIIKAADFLEISEADFDSVMRVNLKGAFLVGQAAARRMVEAGKGAIVNMSSANAVLAIPNQIPYVVSKGAMNQLTNVMALALRRQRGPGQRGRPRFDHDRHAENHHDRRGGASKDFVAHAARALRRAPRGGQGGGVFGE